MRRRFHPFLAVTVLVSLLVGWAVLRTRQPGDAKVGGIVTFPSVVEVNFVCMLAMLLVLDGILVEAVIPRLRYCSHLSLGLRLHRNAQKSHLDRPEHSLVRISTKQLREVHRERTKPGRNNIPRAIKVVDEAADGAASTEATGVGTEEEEEEEAAGVGVGVEAVDARRLNTLEEESKRGITTKMAGVRSVA